MKGDCEAETFEEAYIKNKHRLKFERDEAASLREAMIKDGEDPNGIDPEFWDGCIEANERCWEIWTSSGFLGKPEDAAAAMRRIPAPEGKSKAFLSGHGEFLLHWADAVVQDHPATIVYW